MKKDSVIAQINIHLMWANWHIASTLNGQAKLRQLQVGDRHSPNGWRDLTEDEKIEQAMKTAQSHIYSAHELQDHLIALENS